MATNYLVVEGRDIPTAWNAKVYAHGTAQEFSASAATVERGLSSIVAISPDGILIEGCERVGRGYQYSHCIWHPNRGERIEDARVVDIPRRAIFKTEAAAFGDSRWLVVAGEDLWAATGAGCRKLCACPEGHVGRMFNPPIFTGHDLDFVLVTEDRAATFAWPNESETPTVTSTVELSTKHGTYLYANDVLYGVNRNVLTDVLNPGNVITLARPNIPAPDPLAIRCYAHIKWTPSIVAGRPRQHRYISVQWASEPSVNAVYRVGTWALVKLLPTCHHHIHPAIANSTACAVTAGDDGYNVVVCDLESGEETRARVAGRLDDLRVWLSA